MVSINGKRFIYEINKDSVTIKSGKGEDLSGYYLSVLIEDAIQRATPELRFGKKKWLSRQVAINVVFPKMLDTGKSAYEIANEENLWMNDNEEEVGRVIDEVLENNPKLVADYVGGKDVVINAILGECMIEFEGKGNPKLIRPALEAKLKALRQ